MRAQVAEVQSQGSKRGQLEENFPNGFISFDVQVDKLRAGYW